jgi:hypothetical protein
MEDKYDFLEVRSTTLGKPSPIRTAIFFLFKWYIWVNCNFFIKLRFWDFFVPISVPVVRVWKFFFCFLPFGVSKHFRKFQLSSTPLRWDKYVESKKKTFLSMTHREKKFFLKKWSKEKEKVNRSSCTAPNGLFKYMIHLYISLFLSTRPCPKPFYTHIFVFV